MLWIIKTCLTPLKCHLNVLVSPHFSVVNIFMFKCQDSFSKSLRWNSQQSSSPGCFYCVLRYKLYCPAALSEPASCAIVAKSEQNVLFFSPCYKDSHFERAKPVNAGEGCGIKHFVSEGEAEKSTLSSFLWMWTTVIWEENNDFDKLHNSCTILVEFIRLFQ